MKFFIQNRSLFTPRFSSTIRLPRIVTFSVGLGLNVHRNRDILVPGLKYFPLTIDLRLLTDIIWQSVSPPSSKGLFPKTFARIFWFFSYSASETFPGSATAINPKFYGNLWQKFYGLVCRAAARYNIASV